MTNMTKESCIENLKSVAEDYLVRARTISDDTYKKAQYILEFYIEIVENDKIPNMFFVADPSFEVLCGYLSHITFGFGSATETEKTTCLEKYSHQMTVELKSAIETGFFELISREDCIKLISGMCAIEQTNKLMEPEITIGGKTYNISLFIFNWNTAHQTEIEISKELINENLASLFPRFY